MAKIKIILWENSVTKDGQHPIRLRITQGNFKKYIGLNQYATSLQWFKSTGRFHTKDTKKELKDKKIIIHEKCTEINDYLNTQELKAKEIITDFEKAKINWTLTQFEDKFLHKSTDWNVNSFFLELIKELKETGHIGNSQKYEQTLMSLKLFNKKFANLVFSEIDIKFVQDYNAFLQKPRITVQKLKSGKIRKVKRGSCSGNTRKIYFSTLRAVLNKAIILKKADRSTYPFGNGGFEVGGLSQETEKRYLPSAYLLKLKDTSSLKWENEYARKLFLFSYYTYGMSFADMAALTTRNLKTRENGLYIEYRRAKTEHHKRATTINIKLTDELKKIMSDLRAIIKPVDDYLLPIVTIAGYEGEILYKHTKGRYEKFLKYLKMLSKELKIDDVNLTTYVSRHTMSMTLQGQEVPREVISQILGHKDLKTTATYLDSFNTTVIDEAAKLL